MTSQTRKAAGIAILVSTLGYFVDIYDLAIFTSVRTSSLRSLGLADSEVLDRGVLLLDVQLIGMVLGGILWGAFADKRGRLSALFGSIIVYSLANIANGLVTSVPLYGVLRFISGVGLAGELGAGMTLVAETMGRENRGYGTMVIPAVGVLGAATAGLVSNHVEWRTAYFIGGAMGLLLLVLRLGAYESGMFADTRTRPVKRGSFFALFATRTSTLRYISVVLCGIPIWCTVGMLITLAKEFAHAMHVAGEPRQGTVVVVFYLGMCVGDFCSGTLSQLLRSRRKVVLGFHVLLAAAMALYFMAGSRSLDAFYGTCFVLGLGTGYSALNTLIAAEQVGTNLRATAAGTTQNFVRGSAVLITLALQALRPALGLLGAGIALSALVVVIAMVSLLGVEETHAKDLAYVDQA